MIYTILVALDADPLLPRCRFTGLADLNFTRVKQFAWGLLMYEGIIYLSIAERIHSTHSTHSIRAREPRREAELGERVTYKRGREGMPRSHGNGVHKGNKVSG